MENLLKLLIKPLLSDTKNLKIEREAEGNGIKFTVTVPKEDIAKVIGKEGKMIKSIKNLLKIRAIKEKTFVTIEVKEA